MSTVFEGSVKAKIISVRHAVSGRISSIRKARGDLLKKGDLISSLDKNIFQTDLDRQLKDFERKRAEFEIYNLQKGEPQDDISKYLKQKVQAELDISVKDVEIAKAKLDQLDLYSPVEGIIVDDSNLAPGMYVTPASSEVTIIEKGSYFFETKIKQKDLPVFREPIKLKIRIEGIEKEFEGTTEPIISSPDSRISVRVKIEDNDGLIIGLVGQAYFL